MFEKESMTQINLSGNVIHFALPFRGNKDYLFQTIKSVLEQDDQNWLLTVIENGPVDEQVSNWIAAINDERIRYFFHANDIGLTANFNAVMKKVEGNWGVMIGGDDLLLPNYVTEMYKIIEQFPNAGLIHPNASVIDELGGSKTSLTDKVKKAISISPTTTTFVDSRRLCFSLMVGNWLYFPGICWNMNVYRKFEFDEKLSQTLDLDLALKVIVESGGAVVHPVELFSYRRHSLSFSSEGAIHGERFIEERALLKTYSEIFRREGMHLAMIAAILKLTHRFHAIKCIRPLFQNIGMRKTLSIIFF